MKKMLFFAAIFLMISAASVKVFAAISISGINPCETKEHVVGTPITFSWSGATVTRIICKSLTNNPASDCPNDNEAGDVKYTNTSMSGNSIQIPSSILNNADWQNALGKYIKIYVESDDGNVSWYIKIIPLPAPTNVSAVQEGNSIKITWNPVSGANRYPLYVKKPNESNYAHVVSPSDNSYTYIYTGCDVNGTYLFQIQAENSGISGSRGGKSIAANCTYNSSSTVAVTGVTLNKNSISGQVGGGEILTATVNPANATNKTVTWSSSNNGVATVTDGTVNFVSAGTAIIAVTTADGGKTATCTVNVSAASTPPADITLSTYSISIPVGSGFQLSANQSVNWSSSYPSIASVSSSGYVTAVTAKAVGTTNIYASANGKTATCVVTVIPLTSKHTITAIAGTGAYIHPGSGYIYVDRGCNQTFTFGLMQYNHCYEIDQVLIDGYPNSYAKANGCYTFPNVTSNHTISVVTRPKQYRITATAYQGGSITSSGTSNVNCGESKTYVISPNYGYRISYLQVDGNIIAAASSYTFSNVTAHHTIIAVFVQLPPVLHCISAQAGSGGMISPGGAVNVVAGAGQTFLFTPNAGYEIDAVLVDGIINPAAKANKYHTFWSVSGPHSIFVSFTSTTAVETVVSGETALYPNPVTDQLFIKSALPVKKIEICDLSGHAVKTLHATSLQMDGGVQSVSVSSLPKGLYLVRIYTGNETVVRKMMKN